MSNTINVGDLIKKEAKDNDYLYCSQPYSCGIYEAYISLSKFNCPEENISIERKDDMTIISIKPTAKRKRKLYVIKIWR